MAGVTSYMWENGKGFQTTGAEKHYAHDVEHEQRRFAQGRRARAGF